MTRDVNWSLILHTRCVSGFKPTTKRLSFPHVFSGNPLPNPRWIRRGYGCV